MAGVFTEKVSTRHKQHNKQEKRFKLHLPDFLERFFGVGVGFGVGGTPVFGVGGTRETEAVRAFRSSSFVIVSPQSKAYNKTEKNSSIYRGFRRVGLWGNAPESGKEKAWIRAKRGKFFGCFGDQLARADKPALSRLSH